MESPQKWTISHAVSGPRVSGAIIVRRVVQVETVLLMLCDDRWLHVCAFTEVSVAFRNRVAEWTTLKMLSFAVKKTQTVQFPVVFLFIITSSTLSLLLATVSLYWWRDFLIPLKFMKSTDVMFLYYRLYFLRLVLHLMMLVCITVSLVITDISHINLFTRIVKVLGFKLSVVVYNTL